jgi:perosamine synthetase
MIPVSEPDLGESELAYVVDAMRSGWISSAGKYLEQFEQRWADYCGRKHGVAVSNGTAALQIAARAIELKAGDEVIMPSFTIISCALAIVETGATPVLVDSDPVTWGMDVHQIEARITPRTKAIMVVHIYGHPIDMDPVLALAEQYGLRIIEDAAEVHGAEYLSGRDTNARAWRRCGGFGDVSTFSFYANKIVTTGEGGMVLTDDDHLAARLRSLRNLCFQPAQRFLHEELGYNYRLTNLQAAIGLAQIERIDEMIAAKRLMAARYNERLADLPGVALPAEMAWGRHVYWMYGIVLDRAGDAPAKWLAGELKAAGIETRPFFVGMHAQPVLQRLGLFGGESYPVTDHLANAGLYLPSSTTLSVAQIDQIAAALARVLG